MRNFEPIKRPQRDTDSLSLSRKAKARQVKDRRSQGRTVKQWQQTDFNAVSV